MSMMRFEKKNYNQKKIFFCVCLMSVCLLIYIHTHTHKVHEHGEKIGGQQVMEVGLRMGEYVGNTGQEG